MTRVAVYGSLRKGLGNHHILGLSSFLGEVKEKVPAKMISLGGFPGLLKAEEEADLTYEVYKVTDSILDRLDRLEGHPSFYKRELIDTPLGEAWIYWLQEERINREEVEHGDWKRFVSERH
jgi:gamma-glutamylcyclotransferase (GGCT)/AIG2-like uncharacterized protein YtfP